MLMLLCLGLIYGWSIFVAPLEAEFGWVRAQTSLTFTISMAMFCIGGLAAGMLVMRGIKRSYLMVTAGLLLLGGFYAAGYSAQLAHFYIFYGVLCGFGVGVSYNLLISAVTKLFPGKQGFISGILMMSFGFGGLVLGSLCASLLISLGWRSTFKIIGLLIGLIVIVGSVVIDIAGKKLASQLPVQAATGSGKSGKEIGSREYSVREMMKSPSFIILFAWLVLLSSAGLMIIGHVAPSILELGAEPATAAMAVGVVSVSNGAGRVLFGLSFDRIGMKKTLWLINLCLLTAGLLLSFAVGTANIGLLLFGCAFMGISYGGSPVSTSAVVHRLFGHQNFSGNFSVAVTNLLFAALIGPTVAASLQGSTGSYQTSYYVLIGIGVLALGLCWMLTRRIQEA